MTRITQAVLVEAARAVNRMGAQERLQLADEVFAHQPNLLASVVVLRQMGASDAQIEVPLHVLLVAWQAMKSSTVQWPLISEDTQDVCLQRLTGRVRFAEGLTPKSLRRTVEKHIDEHGEQYLLAFAYGHLRDNGLLAVRTEVEQYLVLVTLNLVECIAFSAAKAPARSNASPRSRRVSASTRRPGS
jgi:hypothetical protein